MSYRGEVRGNVIELDERPPLPEGSRVRVTLACEKAPRRSSPKAVLGLIRKGATDARRIAPGLWGEPGR